MFEKNVEEQGLKLIAIYTEIHLNDRLDINCGQDGHFDTLAIKGTNEKRDQT